MDLRIILLILVSILIFSCVKVVRNIRQTANDEDLEYFSKWR
jgi:hypothetical protein